MRALIVKIRKPLLGCVLIVLWSVFVGKLFSIAKKMPAFNNDIDAPTCLEDLKNGMSHVQVDKVMAGYWFKIPGYINNNMDAYYFQNGLLSAGYIVWYSEGDKLIHMDEVWSQPMDLRFGMLLHLSAKGRTLLWPFRLLKWVTIFYIYWLLLPRIDKWRFGRVEKEVQS